MDPTSAAEFCTRWLAAWTGGPARVDELLSFYAPDALYVDPARPDGLRGHHELRPYLERLLARYPSWSWKVVEIFPTLTGFTLKWSATLHGRGAQGLDIVDVVDGRITRNEVYFDPRALFG